jgi:hypothetical protein
MARDVSLLQNIQTGSGTHPAIYPEGIDGSFYGTERLGREADYSTPHNVEIKTEWS